MKKQVKRAMKATVSLPDKHFDGWATTLSLIWVALTVAVVLF